MEVRYNVRGMLDRWTRRYGATLGFYARAALEQRIVRVIWKYREKGRSEMNGRSLTDWNPDDNPDSSAPPPPT